MGKLILYLFSSDCPLGIGRTCWTSLTKNHIAACKRY